MIIENFECCARESVLYWQKETTGDFVQRNAINRAGIWQRLVGSSVKGEVSSKISWKSYVLVQQKAAKA